MYVSHIPISFRILDSPPLVEVKPLKKQTDTISLLPVEQLLRRLLLDCRDSLPLAKDASRLELRFTGGWVRDKLLGIQSHDIDVGLSTMTGMQFGLALQRFVSEQGAKYEDEAKDLGVVSSLKGLHQIAANPEKSKHLETVTTRIFGLDIDLVNLRKETYTEDSRNPQMEFGTPEEDALRRDACVNALFYNLDTESVEDFTKRGLDDLAAGIIRTPLEPYQTFMDDPLRVLRLIRFASRLGYEIDEQARISMEDSRIHAALNAKISRERVGVEVGKMVNGENPLMAFQLIFHCNLWPTVFLDPTGKTINSIQARILETSNGVPWPPTWPHAYQVLHALLADTSPLAQTLTQLDGEPESLWLMAAYAPLRELGTEEAVRNAREGIKATNKISKLLEKAILHGQEIQSLVRQVNESEKGSEDIPRSTIGMAIKGWGPSWRTQLLYSLLADVVMQQSAQGFFSVELERYAKFVEAVSRRGLNDAAEVKPLLKGDEIQKMFDFKKSGPWMKEALDSVIKWQFDHENGTKEEATHWLLENKETLGIS